MKCTIVLAAVALAGALWKGVPAQNTARAPKAPGEGKPVLKEFERGLEHLRQQLRIPGMAAGVVKDQRLIWARGFGYADMENKIAASPDTPWHIASVTKTFAAIILLQLVEEGRLSLDDPLGKFGIRMKNTGVVRVRHILTHTSEGRPGTFFRYSGRLWEHLAKVIRETSGKTFKELLVERIIRPLDLTDTAPNKEFESENYPFGDVRSRAAAFYRMDKSIDPQRQELALGFYAAGGLFSSVRDMALYDIAIDENLLLKPETKEMMFTPYSSANRKSFPHGLGWFYQDFRGIRLVWHFGWHPDHASALYIKVPAKNLSFMAFANSDKLSQPFNLLHGDVLNSPAALLFLRTFIFPDEDTPEIAAGETMTNDIMLKASGRMPVASPAQKGFLISCLAAFLSAPVLWIWGWLKRRRRAGNGRRVFYGSRVGRGLAKAYALLCLGLCVLFYGALLKAPFLMYWPELPGWIDGVSLIENLFLAVPSLLVLLVLGMTAVTIWVWLRKRWTFFERLHFAGLTVFMAGYILLLDHWHLVGISYYWNYMIR